MTEQQITKKAKQQKATHRHFRNLEFYRKTGGPIEVCKWDGEKLSQWNIHPMSPNMPTAAVTF